MSISKDVDDSELSTSTRSKRKLAAAATLVSIDEKTPPRKRHITGSTSTTPAVAPPPTGIVDQLAADVALADSLLKRITESEELIERLKSDHAKVESKIESSRDKFRSDTKTVTAVLRVVFQSPKSDGLWFVTELLDLISSYAIRITPTAKLISDAWYPAIGVRTGPVTGREQVLALHPFDEDTDRALRFSVLRDHTTGEQAI